jgi:hypothetical protein
VGVKNTLDPPGLRSPESDSCAAKLARSSHGRRLGPACSQRSRTSASPSAGAGAGLGGAKPEIHRVDPESGSTRMIV